MRLVLLGPFGLRPKMTMARRALPLARALSARGHDVRVVLPPWDCPQDSGRIWQEDGVEVVNVRLPPRLPPLDHLWLTARLLRAALRFHPRVIHCFKPKGVAGLAAAALWALQRLRLWRGRLVVDADDWEGWGGWNEIGGYSWMQRHFFAWQEQWGLRHCDAVTVASRWLEQRVGEMRGRRGGVWYVPNGVEQDAGSKEQGAGSKKQEGTRAFKGSKVRRFESSRLTAHGVYATWNLEPSNLQLVLLYTRFVEFEVERVVGIWRRVVELCKVAREQGRKGARAQGRKVAEEQRSKGAGVRLLVVGEGFRGEERELARLAVEAGLGDSVDIIGWVEAEELSRFFAVADVAMMPVDDTILNRARCPARLLDLMAAGLPVVTEAVGEYGHIVEDGVSGLVVSSGDEEAFAAAVVRLLQDANLRQRMGQAAQHRVRTAFAWSHLVEAVEAAYFQPPTSNLQLPTSNFQLPTSNFQSPSLILCVLVSSW
ncbi:MAG: glycosyltransferase family 4 protein [Anaerolineae bacterium]|nr:glycosyltransferase family 4 protein [Anaerolineae bacterium]